MKKAKTISYDCIVVDSKHIPALCAIGNEYIGHDANRNTVYLALRYAVNSDLAHAIRKEALRLGGQEVRKVAVKLV